MIILCIFEGILSIGASFAIPTDSKNAFLFGYSKSRLAIFLFLFLGVLFFIGLLFFKNKILEFIKDIFLKDEGGLKKLIEDYKKVKN